MAPLSTARKIDIVLLSFVAVFLLTSLGGMMAWFYYNFQGQCNAKQMMSCLVSYGNVCHMKSHKSECRCENKFKEDDGPTAACTGIRECLFTRKRICKTHEDVENICIATGDDLTDHTCLCKRSEYVRGAGWKSCVKGGVRVREFFDLEISWKEASAQCLLRGFDGLVVVHDVDSYIGAVMSIPVNRTRTVNLKIHIGLLGELTSDDRQLWIWVDGMPWTYQDYDMWAPDHPMPTGTHPLGLSCVRLQFENDTDLLHSGMWLDASCRSHETANFICEKYQLSV